jgi:dTMP kinase
MSGGLFITFEGIDGCGKSTQLQLLAQRLQAQGVEAVVTREPGGTPFAEKIRQLVMMPQAEEVSDHCEVLLYLAARAQHVQQVIAPALDAGRIVLCDRFQEATFAYQGFGRGVNLERLAQLNSFATGGISPHRTFVFDVSVEVARGRLHKTGKAPDRLEQNGDSFFTTIRQGYLTMAQQHPERIELLAASVSIEQLAEQVWQRVESLRRGC